MQLSIDAKIQYLAYNEVKAVVERSKAKAASAVVLDAQTGEVLALANWPTYNPNDRSRLSGEQLRNRVLTDTFEPGSMMKPISIGLALQLGRVTPSTTIVTTGKFNFEGATISDTHNYGTLTVGGVIQKSSNIGTTKIAMMMKPQEMWDMFTASAWARRRRSASRVPWRVACGRGRAGARSSRRRCPMAMACRCRCSRSRTPIRSSRTTAS
jgi:cell division protein FtsI (penicillin-binding protein 3)